MTDEDDDGCFELLVVTHQVSAPPKRTLSAEFIVCSTGRHIAAYMVMTRVPQAFVDALFDDFRHSIDGWYKVEDH